MELSPAATPDPQSPVIHHPQRPSMLETGGHVLEPVALR